MGHKRRMALACGLVILLALLLGCGKDKPDTEDEGGAAAIPVQVATASLGDIDRTVSADAVLYPVNQANVMPKVSAPVRRVLVNRGDHVKAGQLIAVLENADLSAAVQENRALVEQAQATYSTTTGATLPEDLTKAQADVQAAQQSMDAAQTLYDNRVKLFNEGAIAHKLVDDAKVALVTAQSQLDTARRHLEALQSVGRQEQVKGAQAQLDAAKARYQSAEAQLSYSEVRSPISGVVADRPVYPGEIAAAGSPIFSILDISQIVARANIPVGDARTIRVGQNAIIHSVNGDLEGKVTVVSPSVDPSTTTVEVWIQAPNRGERMKPGVTAHVTLTTENIKNAVLIPAAALLPSDEGGLQVMVVDSNSVAHERPVEVGVRNADQAQIVKGLQSGEKVVTVGGVGLEDKAKVKIEQPQKEEEDEDHK